MIKVMTDATETIAALQAQLGQAKRALRETGHRPYRENTTHWHDAKDALYCPGCAVLADLEA